MKIKILGDPIPKLRPRFTIKNGKPHVYDLNEKIHRNAQIFLQGIILQTMETGDKEDIDHLTSISQAHELRIDINFFLPIPSSWTKKRKNLASWGSLPCNVKPDIDNLVKFYLDICNGVIWSDDAIITHITSRKTYADMPCTIMEILPMTTPKRSPYEEEILSTLSYSDVNEMYDELHHVTSFIMEGDVKSAVSCIEQLAEKYVTPLKKISKLKKKYDENGICSRNSEESEKKYKQNFREIFQEEDE